MDPLRPLGQILEILRQRHADRTSAPASNSAASPARQTENSTPARSADGLEARLRTRLERIDPHNHEARARAFVDAVLVGEFGDALSLDPAYNVLLNQVTEQLLANADTRAELATQLQTLS